MHKFRHVLFLLLTVTVLSVCIPASAAQTYLFLPLNTDAWIETDENGAQLHLWALNNTNTVIRRFLFRLEILNSNGEPAVKTDGGERIFYGSASNISLQPHTNACYTWSLNDYIDAASVTGIQLTAVRFSGGKTWMYSETDNYSYEPDFSWENEMLADGNLEMYYDHTVHLRDTSLGSLARDWYIWSDAENRWIWFSDDLETDCTLLSRDACIKLVINRDPQLYAIKAFRAGMSPFLLLRHMDAADDSTPTLNRYASADERTFVQAEGNWNVAFWDENEYGQRRDWYIWDDAAQNWVWFSSERGPAYKVSAEGTYTVRLVYDGNTENALDVSFTAVRTA